MKIYFGWKLILLIILQPTLHFGPQCSSVWWNLPPLCTDSLLPWESIHGHWAQGEISRGRCQESRAQSRMVVYVHSLDEVSYGCLFTIAFVTSKFLLYQRFEKAWRDFKENYPSFFLVSELLNLIVSYWKYRYWIIEEIENLNYTRYEYYFGWFIWEENYYWCGLLKRILF